MRKEQIIESISNIELSKLKPFEEHPFSIRDLCGQWNDDSLWRSDPVCKYQHKLLAVTFSVIWASVKSMKSLQSIFGMCIAIVRTFAYNISKETQFGKEWHIHGKISKPVCPHRT